MPGQVVGESASSPARTILFAIGVNAAVTGDTAFVIGEAKYVVRNLTVYDASTSLAATNAAVVLRTATGGGGTALTTSLLLNALLSSANAPEAVVGVLTTVQTAPILYLRLTQGASPVAGTFSVALELKPLK